MPIRNRLPDSARKVLIALDYEKSATKVAEEGYALAHALGAEVYLLHVVNDPVYYSALEYSPILGYEGVGATAESRVVNEIDLNKASNFFLDKMKVHLGEENIVDTITEEGDFSETILNTARRIKADMIVLGSHARRGIEKIFTGSVTEEVLNNSEIPLYIIPVKKP